MNEWHLGCIVYKEFLDEHMSASVERNRLGYRVGSMRVSGGRCGLSPANYRTNIVASWRCNINFDLHRDTRVSLTQQGPWLQREALLISTLT